MGVKRRTANLQTILEKELEKQTKTKAIYLENLAKMETMTGYKLTFQSQHTKISIRFSQTKMEASLKINRRGKTFLAG